MMLVRMIFYVQSYVQCRHYMANIVILFRIAFLFSVKANLMGVYKRNNETSLLTINWALFQGLIDEQNHLMCTFIILLSWLCSIFLWPQLPSKALMQSIVDVSFLLSLDVHQTSLTLAFMNSLCVFERET